MTVSTAAKTRLSIGTTLAATLQDEFEADSYTEVGEVEDLGEFGDEAGEILFTALNDRRTRKFKGAFNAGTITAICGFDANDAGQQAMINAFAEDEDYNFKIEFNDPATVSGTPSILYFRGKVMSKTKNVGTVDNVVRQQFTIGINSEILEVLPT